MLYQWDVSRSPIEAVFDSAEELQSISEEAGQFARKLARGTVARVAEIDALIAEHSEHWRLSRMSTVDRNLLRLAVYECWETDTPKKVVINEALEIAKRYSSEESVAFVNGILDAIRAKLETSGSRA
jgi:N utilization substance protein B